MADHSHAEPLEVPPVVLGTMARGNDSPGERKRLFRHALASGIRAFDTAPLYGFGATETQLGEVLAGAGDDIQVFSKVGLSWRPDSMGPVHFETTDPDGRRKVVRRDSRPESIRLDVVETLTRLKRERLDLVHVHFRDSATPIPETMQALAALHQEGSIGAIGVSNFSLAEVQEAAAALHPIPLAAVQIRLNLLQRGPLDPGEIVLWCREQGIAVLAYSPLAEGRLARAPAGRAGPIEAALSDLNAMAHEAGVPMPALSLAWLVNQPDVSGAIIGSSSAAQLDSALEFSGIQPDLIEAITDRFRDLVLRDPWEGPRWKRKLRALKQRLFR